jgi:hypothetical protein
VYHAQKRGDYEINAYCLNIIPLSRLSKKCIDEIKKVVENSLIYPSLITYIELKTTQDEVMIVSEFVPVGNPGDFIIFLMQQDILTREKVIILI